MPKRSGSGDRRLASTTRDESDNSAIANTDSFRLRLSWQCPINLTFHPLHRKHSPYLLAESNKMRALDVVFGGLIALTSATAVAQ